MSGPPSPLIENYLQEAGFWHVATIGQGCKLDPKLISYLMPYLSRNRVHLRWLLKLIDFRATGELSWGSAEMCGATRPNKVKIGGYLSLLQSWVWFRFPFLRSRVNHSYTFPLITRWNHSASYVGIPTSLEHIRLLLDKRSEAQFQWTPYEDPAIRAMHQSDRVLRQFRFRQPILHKVNLRLFNTDWPRHWIHGKPYLLSEEERRRQIRVQRERWGLLNPRRKDDNAGPSAAPIQSLDLSTAPTQPPGPTLQPTTLISQPFQIMPGVYPNTFMFPFPSHMPGSYQFLITPKERRR
ncbi:hypothetical protein GOBAR_AA14763 [Gossypium barbadense]|uniref:Aminotransferase-like plant mobile domain-containing protein n=1 Tax=Gossypium barbadense TaxID=3634 RepID=A0A2P5XRH8_GOSBA|nr:hypothetical protein GOBAR_AA14763 [Gossypium barbadense]